MAEQLTIDLIISDDAAKARVVGFLQTVGTNARVVSKDLQGWELATDAWATKLQRMLIGGGVLWQAHRMAMDIKSAFMGAGEQRVTNRDFKSQVDMAIRAEMANRLPSMKTVGDVLAFNQAVVAQAGGGDIIPTIHAVGRQFSSGLGMSDAEHMALAVELRRYATATGMDSIAYGDFAAATALIQQVAKQAGWGPKEALGFMGAWQNMSPISITKEFSEGLAPILRAAVGMGMSPQDVALGTVLVGHATGDVHGPRTTTAFAAELAALDTVRYGPGQTLLPKEMSFVEKLLAQQKYYRDVFEAAGGAEGGGEAAVMKLIPEHIKNLRGGLTRLGMVAFVMGDFVKALEASEGWSGLSEGERDKRRSTMTALQNLFTDARNRTGGMTPQSLADFYSAMYGNEGALAGVGPLRQLDAFTLANVQAAQLAQGPAADKFGAYKAQLRALALGAGATSDKDEKLMGAVLDAQFRRSDLSPERIYFNLLTGTAKAVGNLRTGTMSQAFAPFAEAVIGTAGFAARAQSGPAGRGREAAMWLRQAVMIAESPEERQEAMEMLVEAEALAGSAERGPMPGLTPSRELQGAMTLPTYTPGQNMGGPPGFGRNVLGGWSSPSLGNQSDEYRANMLGLGPSRGWAQIVFRLGQAADNLERQTRNDNAGARGLDGH